MINNHEYNTLALSHMLHQNDGPTPGKGVPDPVLDFKLDLDDDLVKLAWESTQVPCIKRETSVLCCSFQRQDSKGGYIV